MSVRTKEVWMYNPVSKENFVVEVAADYAPWLEAVERQGEEDRKQRQSAT